MSNTTHSRTVRVFLSSTSRDFAGERGLLVRKVFPEFSRPHAGYRLKMVRPGSD
jgi:hypothetical protein